MNSYEFPNTSSMFEATVLGPHQLGHYLSRKVRILGQFAQCKKSEGIARQLRITLPTLRNHLNTLTRSFALTIGLKPWSTPSIASSFDPEGEPGYGSRSCDACRPCPSL